MALPYIQDGCHGLICWKIGNSSSEHAGWNETKFGPNRTMGSSSKIVSIDPQKQGWEIPFLM
jgi:hypothetical protein